MSLTNVLVDIWTDGLLVELPLVWYSRTHTEPNANRFSYTFRCWIINLFEISLHQSDQCSRLLLINTKKRINIMLNIDSFNDCFGGHFSWFFRVKSREFLHIPIVYNWIDEYSWVLIVYRILINYSDDLRSFWSITTAKKQLEGQLFLYKRRTHNGAKTATKPRQRKSSMASTTAVLQQQHHQQKPQKMHQQPSHNIELMCRLCAADIKIATDGVPIFNTEHLMDKIKNYLHIQVSILVVIILSVLIEITHTPWDSQQILDWMTVTAFLEWFEICLRSVYQCLYLLYIFSTHLNNRFVIFNRICIRWLPLINFRI